MCNVFQIKMCSSSDSAGLKPNENVNKPFAAHERNKKGPVQNAEEYQNEELHTLSHEDMLKITALTDATTCPRWLTLLSPVECNFLQNVVTLDFSGSTIIGSSLSRIRYLRSLKILRLRRCGIRSLRFLRTMVSPVEDGDFDETQNSKKIFSNKDCASSVLLGPFLSNLEVVDLARNHIAEVPLSIFGRPDRFQIETHYNEGEKEGSPHSSKEKKIEKTEKNQHHRSIISKENVTSNSKISCLDLSHNPIHNLNSIIGLRNLPYLSFVSFKGCPICTTDFFRFKMILSYPSIQNLDGRVVFPEEREVADRMLKQMRDTRKRRHLKRFPRRKNKKKFHVAFLTTSERFKIASVGFRIPFGGFSDPPVSYKRSRELAKNRAKRRIQYRPEKMSAHKAAYILSNATKKHSRPIHGPQEEVDTDWSQECSNDDLISRRCFSKYESSDGEILKFSSRSGDELVSLLSEHSYRSSNNEGSEAKLNVQLKSTETLKGSHSKAKIKHFENKAQLRSKKNFDKSSSEVAVNLHNALGPKSPHSPRGSAKTALVEPISRSLSNANVKSAPQNRPTTHNSNSTQLQSRKKSVSFSGKNHRAEQKNTGKSTSQAKQDNADNSFDVSNSLHAAKATNSLKSPYSGVSKTFLENPAYNIAAIKRGNSATSLDNTESTMNTLLASNQKNADILSTENTRLKDKLAATEKLLKTRTNQFSVTNARLAELEHALELMNVGHTSLDDGSFDNEMLDSSSGFKFCTTDTPNYLDIVYNNENGTDNFTNTEMVKDIGHIFHEKDSMPSQVDQFFPDVHEPSFKVPYMDTSDMQDYLAATEPKYTIFQNFESSPRVEKEECMKNFKNVFEKQDLNLQPRAEFKKEAHQRGVLKSLNGGTGEIVRTNFKIDCDAETPKSLHSEDDRYTSEINEEKEFKHKQAIEMQLKNSSDNQHKSKDGSINISTLDEKFSTSPLIDGDDLQIVQNSHDQYLQQKPNNSPYSINRPNKISEDENILTKSDLNAEQLNKSKANVESLQFKNVLMPGAPKYQNDISDSSNTNARQSDVNKLSASVVPVKDLLLKEIQLAEVLPMDVPDTDKTILVSRSGLDDKSLNLKKIHKGVEAFRAPVLDQKPSEKMHAVEGYTDYKKSLNVQIPKSHSDSSGSDLDSTRAEIGVSTPALSETNAAQGSYTNLYKKKKDVLLNSSMNTADYNAKVSPNSAVSTNFSITTVTDIDSNKSHSKNKLNEINAVANVGETAVDSIVSLQSKKLDSAGGSISSFVNSTLPKLDTNNYQQHAVEKNKAIAANSGFKDATSTDQVSVLTKQDPLLAMTNTGNDSQHPKTNSGNSLDNKQIFDTHQIKKNLNSDESLRPQTMIASSNPSNPKLASNINDFSHNSLKEKSQAQCSDLLSAANLLNLQSAAEENTLSSNSSIKSVKKFESKIQDNIPSLKKEITQVSFSNQKNNLKHNAHQEIQSGFEDCKDVIYDVNEGTSLASTVKNNSVNYPHFEKKNIAHLDFGIKASFTNSFDHEDEYQADEKLRGTDYKLNLNFDINNCNLAESFANLHSSHPAFLKLIQCYFRLESDRRALESLRRQSLITEHAIQALKDEHYLMCSKQYKQLTLTNSLILNSLRRLAINSLESSVYGMVLLCFMEFETVSNSFPFIPPEWCFSDTVVLSSIENLDMNLVRVANDYINGGLSARISSYSPSLANYVTFLAEQIATLLTELSEECKVSDSENDQQRNLRPEQNPGLQFKKALLQTLKLRTELINRFTYHTVMYTILEVIQAKLNHHLTNCSKSCQDLVKEILRIRSASRSHYEFQQAISRYQKTYHDPVRSNRMEKLVNALSSVTKEACKLKTSVVEAWKSGATNFKPFAFSKNKYESVDVKIPFHIDLKP